MLLSGTLLTSDKHAIDYHHYKYGHDKVIVIVHGFYNSKESLLLQDLAHRMSSQYDVVLFDFRGHGKSSGLFTWTSKEVKDVQAVLSYIQGSYKKVGMIGFSLGGTISILTLAETKDVHSFVCVSAVSDCHKIDYHLWELDWENDIQYSLFSNEGRRGKGVRVGPFWLKKKCPCKALANIDIPILYIHGNKDWVVKPWHSQKLYDNTKGKKDIVIIENGPHAEYLMRYFSDTLVEHIEGWFRDTLV